MGQKAWPPPWQVRRQRIEIPQHFRRIAAIYGFGRFGGHGRMMMGDFLRKGDGYGTSLSRINGRTKFCSFGSVRRWTYGQCCHGAEQWCKTGARSGCGKRPAGSGGHGLRAQLFAAFRPILSGRDRQGTRAIGASGLSNGDAGLGREPVARPGALSLRFGLYGGLAGHFAAPSGVLLKAKSGQFLAN